MIINYQHEFQLSNTYIVITIINIIINMIIAYIEVMKGQFDIN